MQINLIRKQPCFFYMLCISLTNRGSKVTGLDRQNFQRKIVNIFLPINFNIYALGA